VYSTFTRHQVLSLILVASMAGSALAQTSGEPAYTVEAQVTPGDNQLGVKPGETIFLDFMLDPGITPTASLSTEERLVFIDPWRWHCASWSSTRKGRCSSTVRSTR
jgi:hypothetical protein